MSRIVGDGFFSEDALDRPSDCHSGVPYQDVSPERFSRLEKELVRGKGELVSLAHSIDRRYIYSWFSPVQAPQSSVNYICPD
jgi:hypothetical protein